MKRQRIQTGIKVLTELSQKIEEQIKAAQTNLDLLRGKYKINPSDEVDFGLAPSFPRYSSPEEREKRQMEFERTRPFWDEKRKFVNMVEFHKVLAMKIEVGQLDAQNLETSPVEIVELAVPPDLPAGPNRFLGATLLLIGLFPSVGGWLLIKASRHRRLSI